MNHNYLHDARLLADGELVRRLETLASNTRSTTAELIAHLAELDRRRLYLAASYSSLFAYCHEHLRLSEHEAYERIKTARVVRRFPAVLQLIEDGVVTLTTVRLLTPHLTKDNHVELLTSARGLRRRQVEEMVARLAPRPDVPTSIRKVPSPAAGREPSPALLGLETSSTTIGLPTAPQAAAASIPEPTPASVGAPPSAVVAPLSPDRYKLQVTIDGETLDKLELAQDLLRHAVPSGDPATILGRALSALLVELTRKKFATSDRPRPEKRQRSEQPDGEPAAETAASRHIAAEIKRAVFVRDGGRCAFRGTGGRRCGERRFIEFHHLHPFAYGGRSTVDNVELRCRQHNVYEWELADVRRLEPSATSPSGTRANTARATGFEPSWPGRPSASAKKKPGPAHAGGGFPPSPPPTRAFP